MAVVPTGDSGQASDGTDGLGLTAEPTGELLAESLGESGPAADDTGESGIVVIPTGESGQAADGTGGLGLAAEPTCELLAEPLDESGLAAEQVNQV